jgi:hypothetical protein
MIRFELAQLLESIAVEQLFGLALGSVLLCAMGFAAAFANRKRSAAALFCVWQMVGCSIIATTLSGTAN